MVLALPPHLGSHLGTWASPRAHSPWETLKFRPKIYMVDY